MSHNPNTNRRPVNKTEAAPTKEPNRRLRVGITSVAAVAVVGAIIGGNALRDSNQEHQSRVEALKQIDTPVFETMVLQGGMQLRFTPKIERISASEGDTANLAGEIPKDEVWVVQAPLVDLEKPEWLAVTKPGAENDINSLDDRADNTLWVHNSALLAGAELKGAVVDWKFNDDGTTSVNGEPSIIVGSTFKVDAQSLAVVEGLVNPE
jgi:hypothetical protein